MLFNIFINNINMGLSAPSANLQMIKLNASDDSIEGRDTIERDLDRLKKWAYENLKRCNRTLSIE